MNDGIRETLNEFENIWRTKTLKMKLYEFGYLIAIAKTKNLIAKLFIN